MLFTVACSSLSGTTIKVPVGNYKEANTYAIENTQSIISQYNKSQRKSYINGKVKEQSKLKIDRNENDEIVIRDDTDPNIESTFVSDKQLKIRMAALHIIDTYGNVLVKISSSDATTMTKEAAGGITTDLSLIGKEGEVLEKESAKATQLGNLSAPLTKLVTTITGDITQNMFDKMFKDAVENGFEPIKVLINWLDTETSELYKKKIGDLYIENTHVQSEYNSKIAELEKMQKALKDCKLDIEKNKDVSDEVLNKCVVSIQSNTDEEESKIKLTLKKYEKEIQRIMKNNEGTNNNSSLVTATDNILKKYAKQLLLVTDDVLKKYAEQVITNWDNLVEAVEANPKPMFKDMITAQESLLDYAKSIDNQNIFNMGKKQQVFNALANAMEDYLARMKEYKTHISNFSKF